MTGSCASSRSVLHSDQNCTGTRAYRSAADATRGSGRSGDPPDLLAAAPVEHLAIRVDDDVATSGRPLFTLRAGAAPLARHRLRAEIGEQLALLAQPVQANLEVAFLAVAANPLRITDRATARQGLVVEGDDQVGSMGAGVGGLSLLGQPAREVAHGLLQIQVEFTRCSPWHCRCP